MKTLKSIVSSLFVSLVISCDLYSIFSFFKTTHILKCMAYCCPIIIIVFVYVFVVAKGEIDK